MILLCIEILCASRSLLWDLMFLMGSYLMMTWGWNSAVRSQPGLCFDSFLLYNSLSCVHCAWRLYSGEFVLMSSSCGAWFSELWNCASRLQPITHLFWTKTFMNTFIWLNDFWLQIVGSSCTELLLSLSVKLWLWDYHSWRLVLWKTQFSWVHMQFANNHQYFYLHNKWQKLWNVYK